MVVNLEYIKAIVTTEEVLILDPLRQEELEKPSYPACLHGFRRCVMKLNILLDDDEDMAHLISQERSGSLVSSTFMDDNDVEDLEMLLEAYFMQLGWNTQ
ncbi:hypothetical protein MLD38_023164 [Melastoma candidum]|uniref:Uncharacterized protein n=1 Tax=Melastoma candidum TaxID=119954 RepID=A0ACB9QLN6_9MYRT|nr:hypothetical protein MLD38_023164 [Melastoma candidum]